jgi:hypothetical protein
MQRQPKIPGHALETGGGRAGDGADGRAGLIGDGEQDGGRLLLGLGAQCVERRVLDGLPRFLRGLLGVDALLLEGLERSFR